MITIQSNWVDHQSNGLNTMGTDSLGIFSKIYNSDTNKTAKNCAECIKKKKERKKKKKRRKKKDIFPHGLILDVVRGACMYQ